MYDSPISTSRTRGVDRFMLLLILANALLALWLGLDGGRWLFALGGAAAVLAPTALARLVRVSPLVSRYLHVLSLTGMVALQFQLGSVAMLVPNLFVTLAVLQIYRDWRVQLLATALLVGAYVAAPGTFEWRASAATLGFLAALCAATVACTRRMAAEADARFEMEFLVNAMGRSGPVRLNLDVVRAKAAAAGCRDGAQGRMATALRQVRDVIFSVHAAAEEMSSSSSELMSRTNNTANGLRDAAMSLEQINVIVQDSVRASREARELSQAASGMATEGGQVVVKVVEAMNEISSSSKRITDIIGVIDGIAFQTNILALNAAVEAARAGEAGRGFAVVAGEVRLLAQRSSEAAREIKTLINTSLESVERGSSLASQAGGAMERLVQSVQRVGAVFESLTADSSEHAQGIDVVTSSVRELDAVTRMNVRTAERSGDIAFELLAQAAKLAEVLSAFRLGDDQAVLDLKAAAEASHARESQARADRQPGSAQGESSQASQANVEFF